MLTCPASTRTGTFRVPLVSRSISSRAWGSSRTSLKLTFNPSLLLASRALKVKGQLCLPKIVTSWGIFTP